MDTPKRSAFKAVSWRVTATITTMIISFIITGNIDAALKIGLIEVFAKMALYYFHERIWSRLRFGIKKEQLDYQI